MTEKEFNIRLQATYKIEDVAEREVAQNKLFETAKRELKVKDQNSKYIYGI